MGIFTFKWPHAAEEVYVTGTFDNWSKSEKLEKSGEYFEKTVVLPDDSEKIYYKFVVDGNWTTDHTAAQEKDAGGNENNVLKPTDIIKDTPSAAIMSSVGPNSTTAELAKDVPLEKDKAVPGTFPETPMSGDPEKQFSVDPLPAAPGGIFPEKLAPGEPIPEHLKGQSVTDNVTLDKESYENSGSGLGTSAAISSVGAGSTTVGLAAGVPLESKVPEVVKESQEEAGVDAEASGVSAEVQEKAQVEDELLKKVPEAPSTSEGTAGQGTDKSENDKTLVETITGTAAAAGAAAFAAAAAAKTAIVGGAGQATAAATEAGQQLPVSVKQVLPTQAQAAIAGAGNEVSPEVPEEVKESIAAAGDSPEAAANTAAVEEKKAVEAELLKEVKPVEPATNVHATVDQAKSQLAETTESAKTATGQAAEQAKGLIDGAQAKASEATDKATAAAGQTADKAADAVDSPASSSKPADSAAAAADKKKKNRLSQAFGKLKSRLGGKDK